MMESGKMIIKMVREFILTSKREKNTMDSGNKGKKMDSENSLFKVGTSTKVDFKTDINKAKEL